jgi:PAS domain-containing protein
MAILQHEVEVILARHLASNLAMPIFIVDTEGTLLYYNEPAGLILGLRFEETGSMAAAEWSTIFTPIDDEGRPIPPEGLPLMIALNERRPSHKMVNLVGMDRVPRRVANTAFPLLGQARQFLGAMAIFWEESA